MDAAIAAAATLAVVEPTMTGVGGDAFFLYYEAERRSVYGFNGSGRSPRSLAAEEVLLPGRVEIETDSWDAVTVPGAVDAWVCGHQRFGRLPFNEVLEPAIRYAEEGFAVTEVVHASWSAYEATLAADPEAARTYLVDGRVPGLGSIFVNPRLAQSLRAISDGGADAFYRGPLAAEIVRYAQSRGSALSAADFAAHRSEWVEPISTHFRDFEMLQLPPNGQGLAVLLMLNLLDGFELEKQKHNSPEYLHLLVEAKKLAYADAHRWIADPQGAPIPIEDLLSQSYAAERRRLIDPARASEGTEGGLATDSETVYLTAVDESGNAVSFINSLFDVFGGKKVGGKTGILLQNRGCGFSLDPGHPNAFAPGKRPFHTIIPGMVLRDGRLHLSYGLMGGSMQPQGHVQFLLSHLVFGLGLREAIDVPRWRHTRQTELLLEHGTPRSTMEALRALGHDVVPALGGQFGGAQAILVDAQTGTYLGASDPRKDGCALGY